MKSCRIVLVIFVFFLGSQVSGQSVYNSLGLRLSGDDDNVGGVGTEVSYQHAIGSNNRIELDLGFRDSPGLDVLKLTAVYHWVWNIEGGFNWYAGPAVGAGIVDYDNDWPPHRKHDYTNLLLSAGGDLGLEYVFGSIPLQLALDLRPQIYLLEDFYDDFDVDIGFAIRYQFR